MNYSRFFFKNSVGFPALTLVNTWCILCRYSAFGYFGWILLSEYKHVCTNALIDVQSTGKKNDLCYEIKGAQLIEPSETIALWCEYLISVMFLVIREQYFRKTYPRHFSHLSFYLQDWILWTHRWPLCLYHIFPNIGFYSYIYSQIPRMMDSRMRSLIPTYRWPISPFLHENVQ